MFQKLFWEDAFSATAVLLLCIKSTLETVVGGMVGLVSEEERREWDIDAGRRRNVLLLKGHEVK